MICIPTPDPQSILAFLWWYVVIGAAMMAILPAYVIATDGIEARPFAVNLLVFFIAYALWAVMVALFIHDRLIKTRPKTL